MPADVADRPTATREALLDAAQAEFTDAGFRRTSMVDVARRAGLARATLYQHWSSKEELFRGVMERLHAGHVAALKEVLAAPAGLPLEERLVAALEARLLGFVTLTAGSAHAAELYDVADRLCADLSRTAFATSDRLLARLLREAAGRGEIDLSRSGLTAAQAAAVLVDCAHGAKGDDPSAVTVERFREALRRALRLVVRGLGA